MAPVTFEADIQNQYLYSPTPEYNQALDLAAASLNRASGNVAAVLTSSFYAVELLKRIPGALDFVNMGAFDLANFITSAQGWAWGRIQEVTLDQNQRNYHAVMWAEPEVENAAEISLALRNIVNKDAYLAVIVPTRLRRFLPDTPASILTTKKQPTPMSMVSMLEAAGWGIQCRAAFHGPRAFAWSLFARAAHVLRRPDWGDRCLFAMRAHYMEPGWLWPLTPLTLILAKSG